MATANLQGDTLVLQTDWTEKDLAAQITGLYYDSPTNTWHGPASWSTFVMLCGVFHGRLQLGPALYTWYTQQWSWYTNAMIMRDCVESDQTSHDSNSTLYPFQRVSVEFHANQAQDLGGGGTLDCSDMGTGKTIVALHVIRHTLPALVVCPNSVKSSWLNETNLWLEDATPYVIGGGAQNRRKQLDAAREDPSAIVIINYESLKAHSRLAPYGSVRLIRCKKCGGSDEELPASRCHKHDKELNDFPFRSVVLDEAHRLKDPRAQQTRACWAVAHQDTVIRRLALTGTPIASDVSDLWSILHAVAPTDFPTKSKWIERYALLAWNRTAQLDVVGVKPDTRAEFDQSVQPRMRRVLKAQVLPQLPPKIRIVRHADLTPQQRKMYDRMRHESLAETEDGDIIASPTNLSKATRLLQFASASAEINDEGDVKLSAPSGKLDVLEEILQEVGSRQIVVCALSRQLIELAAKRLDEINVTYRLLTGAVNQWERPRNIDDFQQGRAQCMLFTLQAGGVGITLTAADTMVRLQRSWSLIDNRQAEDRVHRIGSERHESIAIIDVIAPGTIEVRQTRTLNEKLRMLDEVTQDRARLLALGLSSHDIDEREQAILSGTLL